MRANGILLGLIVAAAGAAWGCAAAIAFASQSTSLPFGVRALAASDCQALESEAFGPVRASTGWGTHGQLDQVGAALTELGGGAFADTFSSIIADVPGNKLLLYTTNNGRAGAMILAARAKHPGLDVQVIQVCQARYTAHAMVAAVHVIVARHDPTIYTITSAPDGSGIAVTVKPGTEHGRPADVAGVRVTYTPGSPVTLA